MPSLSVFDHIVDLRADRETLFKQLDSSTRRGIRKAEKAGVEVEFRTDLGSMREYYRLHCLTRRNKHGLPPQPWRFFEKVHEHLIARGMGIVALSRAPSGHRDEGRKEKGEGRGGRYGPDARSPLSALRSPGATAGAIAGAVFLHYDRTALYKFGAADDAYLDFRPNNVLMWKAFLRCKELGCERLGMGRTNLDHEGLRRFKLGFGATEKRTDYYKLDLKAGQWVSEKDKTTGWHNRFFRALPLWANRWAGQVLYPHLD